MAEYAKRIGEVAERLEVSSQTIRNWLNLGEELYSEAAQRQYGKRFSPSDIEQLERVQSFLYEGYRLDQIKNMLPAAPQVVEIFEDQPPPSQQDSSQSRELQTPAIMEQFLQLINQQAEEHQRELERLERSTNRTIEVLESENQRLREELERARLPWWRRLF